MGTFKRLCITAVIGAAGGVANVTDGGSSVVLFDELLGFFFTAETENFIHSADVFMGTDELLSLGIVARHSSCELASILNIKEQAWNQSGCLIRVVIGDKRGDIIVNEMIYRSNAAFVKQFGHEFTFRKSQR